MEQEASRLEAIATRVEEVITYYGGGWWRPLPTRVEAGGGHYLLEWRLVEAIT